MASFCPRCGISANETSDTCRICGKRLKFWQDRYSPFMWAAAIALISLVVLAVEVHIQSDKANHLFFVLVTVGCLFVSGWFVKYGILLLRLAVHDRRSLSSELHVIFAFGEAKAENNPRTVAFVLSQMLPGLSEKVGRLGGCYASPHGNRLTRK